MDIACVSMKDHNLFHYCDAYVSTGREAWVTSPMRFVSESTWDIGPLIHLMAGMRHQCLSAVSPHGTLRGFWVRGKTRWVTNAFRQ